MSGLTAEDALALARKYTKKSLAGAGALKGDKGDKGDQGITPHIGENGNWFIDTIDTGVKAGAVAENSITYVAKNTLVITQGATVDGVILKL